MGARSKQRREEHDQDQPRKHVARSDLRDVQEVQADPYDHEPAQAREVVEEGRGSYAENGRSLEDCFLSYLKKKAMLLD